MKNAFLLLTVVFNFIYISSQTIDTLSRWNSSEYKASILAIDSEGDWTAIRKNYPSNNDTVEIYNTRSGKRYAVYVGLHKVLFPGKNKVVIHRHDMVEVSNLKQGTVTHYSGIKTMDNANTTSNGAVMLLQKNGDLTLIGDQKDRVILTHVHEIIKIRDAIVWAWQYRDGRYWLVSLSPRKQLKIHYNTPYPPVRWNNKLNDDFLVFNENIDAQREKILLLSYKEGRVYDPEINYDKIIEGVRITEAGGNHTFLIEHVIREPKKDSTVDIWNGNDRYLEAKRNGQLTYDYYLWNTQNGKKTRLKNPDVDSYVVTGNARYLATFNRKEFQDYTKRSPDILLRLLDMYTGNLLPIDTIRPEIVIGDGRYILYKKISKEWEILHLGTMKRKSLGQQGEAKPTFSKDGKGVWFGGSKGVTIYSPENNRWTTLYTEDVGKAEIHNRDDRLIHYGYNMYQRILPSDTVVVAIRHESDLTRTVFFHHRGKNHYALTRTPYHVHQLHYSKNNNALTFIRENYSNPSEMVHLRDGTTSVARHSNRKEVAIRQEVVHFTNSKGILLKGTLYYPISMDQKKLYPLVVHPYQIIHPDSRNFPYREIPRAGFNIRSLIERGYFVYLPDVVFDERGTGISALDAIHCSIDALKKIPNINFNKIGLIGHSHGGYETNFVATHSDRFAAYISGAGNSDLIRSYFSYNYNFDSPFYMQYENGQYEMNVPFSEDKDKYMQNSPIHFVENVKAPILLWAGKKDRNIDWDQVMEFYIGLNRNKKSVIALFYPHKAHDLGMNSVESGDLMTRVLDWWDYWLRDNKIYQWIIDNEI